MTITQLTTTQRQVLEHAADHADGRIDWFPDGVRGGARKKVLDGLSSRALITTNGSDWFIAAEGYDALGRARPAVVTLDATPEIETAETASEATSAQNGDVAAKPLIQVVVEGKPRSRANSKQSTLIQMLQRPAGATIAQVCEATGWQKHTVRGTLSGVLKRKLGLSIISSKSDQGERIYHIQN